MNCFLAAFLVGADGATNLGIGLTRENIMTVYTVITLDDPAANSPEIRGSTRAQGINDAGQIVGSYTVTTVDPTSLFNYGFLYNRQDGTYTTIDEPLAGPRGSIGHIGTFAQDINDVGQVVGYYTGLLSETGPSGTFGFLYSGGTYTPLNVSGAAQTPGVRHQQRGPGPDRRVL
jgi:uncharacterized membrane protein